jgi:oxidase EvaA
VISEWIADRRRVLEGSCRPIDLAASHEWSLVNGRLEHSNGAFFSVCGVTADAPGQFFHRTSFPLIDQPEIGLLAFLVTGGGNGKDWLLQAKSEPGAVHWVQIGPTVQATESNYLRRHGGAETRFLDYFTDGLGNITCGELQSEQGSRFLNKYNRNAIVEIDARFTPEHENWNWYTSDDVRTALAQDFLINTDSRSVIATHAWRFLRDREALFTGETQLNGHESLRQALAESYAMGAASSHHILAGLQRTRNAVQIRLEPCSLHALPGWRLTDSGLESIERKAYDGFVRYYAIEAPQREKERWDQPCIGAEQDQCCALVIADIDGVAKVGLRYSVEPGFANRVQLGPSYQSDCGNPLQVEALLAQTTLPPVLQLRQSDEGGRFMHLVMIYSIYDYRGQDIGATEDALLWVNLAELEWLCRQSGVITNEARSAVSLLLALA